MKSLFLNELSSSFMLFLDREICYQASAFFNVLDEPLSDSLDNSFAGKTIYQSKYKQWLADEDFISLGAIIPKEIKNGSIIITQPSHGLKFDFNMGRLFLDNTYPTSFDSITASFSVKEFNIFLTTKDETELFLGDSSFINTELKPVSQPYPLIYLKHIFGENNPFAFGGMDDCIFDFRCSIMANSAFKLDSICSVLQDCGRKSFPIIPVESIPFDIFGDIKLECSPFKYSRFYELFGNNLCYIESAKVSKFSEKINKQIKDGLWGASVDFKLSAIRHPRKK
jgi:hypothetical protein